MVLAPIAGAVLDPVLDSPPFVCRSGVVCCRTPMKQVDSHTVLSLLSMRDA